MKKFVRNKSKLQAEKECFYCGRRDYLDPHEFLCGNKRTLAADDGLWVWVCRYCHDRVQHNESAMNAGKRYSQYVFEREIGTREEYFNRYGKYYADEEPTTQDEVKEAINK